MKKKESKELKCCLGCGRDTCAKSGYCRKCIGRGYGASHISEQKGRKQTGPLPWL